MFRLLKFVLFLGVIGVAGLYGYSYFLDPEPGAVTQTISLDAG